MDAQYDKEAGSRDQGCEDAPCATCDAIELFVAGELRVFRAVGITYLGVQPRSTVFHQIPLLRYETTGNRGFRVVCRNTS
jgi:hypothetical protein